MSCYPLFFSPLSFHFGFFGDPDLALMLRKKHLACQQSAQLATLGYDQTIAQVQTEPLVS